MVHIVAREGQASANMNPETPGTSLNRKFTMQEVIYFFQDNTISFINTQIFRVTAMSEMSVRMLHLIRSRVQAYFNLISTSKISSSCKCEETTSKTDLHLVSFWTSDNVHYF